MTQRGDAGSLRGVLQSSWTPGRVAALAEEQMERSGDGEQNGSPAVAVVNVLNGSVTRKLRQRLGKDAFVGQGLWDMWTSTCKKATQPQTLPPAPKRTPKGSQT